MAGVGTYGGYAPPVTSGGVPVDYPVGPVAWTSTATWPVRTPERLYANDLNAQLSAPMSFLMRKPMFQGAQQQAVQSVSPNTWTGITLDTEIYDPWSMHNDSSDTSRIIIPYGCDGIYLVQGCIPFLPTATGAYVYSAGIMHNGTVTAAGDKLAYESGQIQSGAADLVVCAQGDYLQLGGWCTYTSAVDTNINVGSAGTVQYLNYATPLMTGRWVAASGQSLPGGTFSGGAYNGITVGIPDPATWAANEEATANLFNSNIRNSVLFLANVPVFRATMTGTPAEIPSGTNTQVTGLVETIDNWGAFNASTSTWTCPLSGAYLVIGSAGFNSESTAFTQSSSAHCVQSGTTNNYSGSGGYAVWNTEQVMRTLRFTAGDTMQLYTYQNSGSSLTLNGAADNRLCALWVSE